MHYKAQRTPGTPGTPVFDTFPKPKKIILVRLFWEISYWRYVLFGEIFPFGGNWIINKSWNIGKYEEDYACNSSSYILCSEQMFMAGNEITTIDLQCIRVIMCWKSIILTASSRNVQLNPKIFSLRVPLLNDGESKGWVWQTLYHIGAILGFLPARALFNNFL